MKFRFFLILLISLSSVGISLSITFSYYLNNERLELLDVQLRDSAVVLVNSELAEIKKIKFAEAEELITEELGNKGVGKMFIVRNDERAIIFKSATAELMHLDPPTSPQIFTYSFEGQQIRILNLQLPKRPGRTLQVGAVIDPTIHNWDFISSKLAVYIIITMIPILLFAYLLTNYLLRPLNLMASHLQIATKDLQNLKPVPALPKKLVRYSDKSRLNNDEFAKLVVSTNALLERININYKMTKPWTYQLAHEIKTPLSILNFDVEALRKENLVDSSIISSMNEQIDRVSILLSQFLEWASVENNQAKDNLFALKMSDILHVLVDELERIYPARIELIRNQDYTVIANPHHMQQLLSNLIINALKYSPPTTKVKIESTINSLKISDNGPGIPPEVLERVGQPFNSGPANPDFKHKRSGLGLAWINTLTKIYNWNLDINTSRSGTTVVIQFPKNL